MSHSYDCESFIQQRFSAEHPEYDACDKYYLVM